jgi:predicted NUDIX family NTP pyrophosphohydrolase
VSVRRSAGLLLYRESSPGALQVLLGHMGGPLWARRDEGAWTIPKGEYPDDEEPLAAARREFTEELGLPVPEGPVIELGSVRQAGGKTVTAFAVRGDLDPAAIVPGTFSMVWPPRSGVTRHFPELDRVAWLDPAEAARLIIPAQRAFLSRLTAQPDR